MKDGLKFLTCGNVDDGKSTLIGHLLYNLNQLYLDQIESVKMDQKSKSNDIDYSLLLDGLDEEREQGITIDVAYKYFSTDKRSFIILDLPGHEQYTRNMAVGASQAELAIILIDATKGIVNQTKRHFNICNMMGIKNYIIAVNKMDLVDYSEAVYNNILDDINNSFRLPKLSIDIVPLSAINGDNITELSSNMPWYSGLTLIEYLENAKIIKKDLEKFIMPIQRVANMSKGERGYQGNVCAGKIKKGDTIKCLPSREKATVKTLYNTDIKTNTLVEGNAATVVLNEKIDVSRGCVLTNDDNIKVTNYLNLTLFWMDDNKLELNHAYYIKIGTMSTLGYVRNINYKVNVTTGEKDYDSVVYKNDIINCDIEVLEKLPVTVFNYNKDLGSAIFISRETNYTCACATINKILDDNKLYKHSMNLTKDKREELLHQKSLTIWFTGLSCAGKSTIADELEQILSYYGFHTMILDGDNVRLGLNKDLSFSENDRIENIRRVAEVAKIINDAGIICITAFISPLEINRIMAKKIIGDDFVLVYVNTSIEKCEERDKKGLYQKAKSGKIKDFTGISSPYEIPKKPDLVINNDDYKECAMKVYDYIKERIKK